MIFIPYLLGLQRKNNFSNCKSLFLLTHHHHLYQRFLKLTCLSEICTLPLFPEEVLTDTCGHPWVQAGGTGWDLVEILYSTHEGLKPQPILFHPNSFCMAVSNRKKAERAFSVTCMSRLFRVHRRNKSAFLSLEKNIMYFQETKILSIYNHHVALRKGVRDGVSVL